MTISDKENPKRLLIEWIHLSVGGETCERCGTTGAAVMEAVDDLTFELGEKDIRVLFREVVIRQGSA